MKIRKWIVLVWVVIILLLLVAASYVSHLTALYMPVVYSEYVEPSVTPIATATPRPGIWTFVGGAFEKSKETKILGLKPSVCYAVTSSKEWKTITVLSHYIGDAECEAWVEYWNEHGNIPHEIQYPLPICTGNDAIDGTFFPCFCPTYELSQQGFFCGAGYSHIYSGGSQFVCSGDIEDQCVETR